MQEAIFTVFLILLCLSFSSPESPFQENGGLGADGEALGSSFPPRNGALELLRECLVPHALLVPLESQGATSADWQQDDMLSIAALEEVGEQELAFLSVDVESDSTSPAVKLSLSAELLPLIKRATAVLQVPWPT
ncbi:UNVERIFIED_CONTAM: hypothetical protein FKN15_008487 [Acipenser sinensis]